MICKKNTFLKFTATFLLLCLLLGQANLIVNGHIHYLSGNKIIFHAHPYQKRSIPNFPGIIQYHSHSDIEIIQYDLLTRLFEQTDLVLFIGVLIGILITIIRLFSSSHIFNMVIPQPISRGPPVFSDFHLFRDY